MLQKLKVECGYQYTTKLEGMFNDMKARTPSSSRSLGSMSGAPTPSPSPPPDSSAPAPAARCAADGGRAATARGVPGVEVAVA